MSRKNIRVAWEDLQPGDLLHVKGSSNVYRFAGYGKNSLTKAQARDHLIGGGTYAFVDFNDARIHPVGNGFSDILPNVVILYRDFAYATRPAPKTLDKPSCSGEYRLRNKEGWHKLIVVPEPVFSRSNRKHSYLVRENTYSQWEDVVEDMHPIELLDIEEYYTRKIKGEL